MNWRRWRNVTLWLGLGAIVSPIGFNCHQATDLSAANSRLDSTEQSFSREPATINAEPDGAEPGSKKIRVNADKMRAQTANSAKTLRSFNQTPAKLLALFDNKCRDRRTSPLRFEAEEIQLSTEQSVEKVTAQAEADPCLVRLDVNQYRTLAVPVLDRESNAPFSAEATANDSRSSEQKQLSFTKALLSWDWFYSGVGLNSDVVVAVVDSGVLHTHPDLVDNMATTFTGSRGYDFINNDENPTDDYGHGTHVAGIIGARANNSIGVAGIGGNRVRILAVKVLDNKGGGSDVTIVNGIRYAADQGAQVINLSLGGAFESPAIRDALVYAVSKGAVITIAAGNDAVMLDAGSNFYAPAGYAKDIPGAVAVASVDATNGTLSSFSNFSTAYVSIAAPGSGGILSTYTGNSYVTLQGTSMAAPAVAGAAALVVGAFRARGIAYVPADVINLLIESARPVASLNGSVQGGATLDLDRAAKLFYSRYVMSGNGGTEVQ